jgi:uncharacterized protein involved in response to NO
VVDPELATVGPIGALMPGMITRTAPGHTGRPLVADYYEVGAFQLVTAAAMASVFAPLAVPPAYRASIIVSACLCSAAYLI